MRVIFSEFLPYSPSATIRNEADSADVVTDVPTTSVLVADSSQLGFLVTEYEPRVTDFQDPLRDIQQFKLMEKYAVAPKSDRAYIVSVDNVALTKGYDSEFLLV
jgi:hypothetical protein